MTQVEPMLEENQQDSSSSKGNLKTSVNAIHNNNNKEKQGIMDKTKIPSPLSGHKSSKQKLPKMFKFHWHGDKRDHNSAHFQMVSIKLERLHHWSDFLEEVNSSLSQSFPGSVRQVFNLAGQSLTSLSELENQNELIVCGESISEQSSSHAADKPKSQLRVNSASKSRRIVRANFTKSVIIEPTPDDLEEANSLMKTFSEQNVSFRTEVSNSLNSQLLNPLQGIRNASSRPRPVSCFAVRTPPPQHGDKKTKVYSPTAMTVSASASVSASRIPKRISRASDIIMSISTPPPTCSSSLGKLVTRSPALKTENNKAFSQARPARNESLRRDFVLPRLVTIIVKGRKPRKTSRFLLNKKTAIAFEQVLNDITESVKPDWGAVRKVYTLSAKEVTTLEDFFQTDKIFLVCPNDRVLPEDFELDGEECKILKVPQMLPLKRSGKGFDMFKSPNRRVKCGNDQSHLSSRTDPRMYQNHPKQLESVEYPDRITDKYSVGEIIGDGNFAVVRECTDKVSGEKYALKVIDKSKCNRDTPPDHEVTILTKILHPNIILLFDKFNYNNELYVIMELVPGGDLFDAIAEVTKFSEQESVCMTRDVASALSFLHSKNIVHRDIKPENLLVAVDNNGRKRIKLGDFGLAQEITGPLYTVCGTPTYVSPEILAEVGYGKAVDIWALGVILYILLCGYPPFVSPTGNQEDLFDLILSGDFEFHPENWDEISEDAKNLITLMLEIDPELRLESDEVLNHPFLCSGSDETTGEKRNMFDRRDDFKFSIFEKMGLNLPMTNNPFSNSSI